MGRILWLLGYPDQARQMICEALNLAQEISHPASRGLVLLTAAGLYRNYREPQKTRELAEEIITYSIEQGIAQLAWGTFWRGWAEAVEGHKEGISEMRKSLAAQRATGTKMTGPSLGIVLADALGGAGQVVEALSVLDEALDAAHSIGERFAEAEMYRLKGQLLLRRAAGMGSFRTAAAGAVTTSEEQSLASQAETYLRQSIDIARRQGAKSWELRATMSLSRLYLEQNRKEEARRILAEVYGWFTEGFDTADLREAGALLEEL